MDVQSALGMLGVAVVALAVAAVARRVGIAYQAVLVVVGALVGFVPGVPTVRLAPEVVLLLFLPALVYVASFTTSPRELVGIATPVAALATGLVLATSAVVAVTAHVVLGLDWGISVVLGTVLAPTDPVAATSVMARLGVRNETRLIIEGEGLVNDGLALVLYSVAVTAAVSGAFSLGGAAVELLKAIGIGVAMGLLVGFLVHQANQRLHDPPIEVAVSIMVPFLAYLPADLLGGSGVLATLAAGLFLGWRSESLFSAGLTAGCRIGLADAVAAPREHTLRPGGPGAAGGAAPRRSPPLGAGGLVGPGGSGDRRPPSRVDVHGSLRAASRACGPVPAGAALGARERFLVSWSGMRGAVSLAAALAVPLLDSSGADVAGRTAVVAVTFGVVLLSLVGQGLSVVPLVGVLGLRREGDDPAEAEARASTANAALEELDRLEAEGSVSSEVAGEARIVFERRLDEARAQSEGDDPGGGDQAAQVRDLRRRLLDAQRVHVQRLRADGQVSNDVFRQLQRDLDLEAQRLA